MAIISSKAHAYSDYTIGLLLTAGTYVFEWGNTNTQTWWLFTTGIVMLTSAMITRYEGGLVKWLSYKGHLLLDLILGIALSLSAIVTGRESVCIFNLICGFGIIMITVFSMAGGKRMSHYRTRKSINRL